MYNIYMVSGGQLVVSSGQWSRWACCQCHVATVGQESP